MQQCGVITQMTMDFISKQNWRSMIFMINSFHEIDKRKYFAYEWIIGLGVKTVCILINHFNWYNNCQNIFDIKYGIFHF